MGRLLPQELEIRLSGARQYTARKAGLPLISEVSRRSSERGTFSVRITLRDITAASLESNGRVDRIGESSPVCERRSSRRDRSLVVKTWLLKV